ncbi:hypothetical protein [Corynebacterium hiratae]|uniref:hypothetical protein n=1 Tax=Corynebacterium hiratae TaxID=3139423 RepID=UPI00272E2F9C|nr:hypothetical protein [Corynebacterium aurimucosum]
MQAIITHQSEVSKKTERHRKKCLEQMYFELSEMHVHNVTLESRQEAQNRRDVAHIVALQARDKVLASDCNTYAVAMIPCSGFQMPFWEH